MSLLTVNGLRVLRGEVTSRLVGRWSARLLVDAATAPTGEVTLEAPGLTMRGFVPRGGDYAETSRVFVVGGRGGLSKPIAAKYYKDATVRLIASDTVRSLGESLAPSSDAAVLNVTLERWARPAGIGLDAIRELVKQVPGASWRVLDDGSVWLGRDTWPASKAQYLTIHDNPDLGVLTLAGDDASLRAGQTFDGRQLREVVHTFEPDAVRTIAHYGRGLSDALGDLVARRRGDLDVFAYYPARVVAQDGAGLLEVVADSPKLKDVTRAPLRLGLPGVTVKVKPGARVLIAFEEGDRSKPVATLWEADGLDTLTVKASTKVVIDAPAVELAGEGGRGVARIGDLVQVAFLPLATPSGATIPVAPATKHTATGRIVSASNKVKGR